MSQPKTDLNGFLANCPKDAGDFISAAVNEAQRRGLIVYWGTKGFSLRAPRFDGKTVSIFYGYPPKSTDGPPYVQVYLQGLQSTGDANEIRQRLLAAAPLQEKGAYTLELVLVPKNMEHARRVIGEVWRIGEELRQSPEGAPNVGEGTMS